LGDGTLALLREAKEGGLVQPEEDIASGTSNSSLSVPTERSLRR